MMTGPCGTCVTSPEITSIFGCSRTFRVTIAEKPYRSTARQPPASTLVASAQARIRLPTRRSSSFRRPTAFSNLSPRREFEQTNSAKSAQWWAGDIFAGFISCSSTRKPRSASCHAASLPASPAPITLTFIILSFPSWFSAFLSFSPELSVSPLRASAPPRIPPYPWWPSASGVYSRVCPPAGSSGSSR